MRWPESAMKVPGALFASAVLVLAVASGCAMAPAPSPTAPEHWPTDRWPTASPESEGIDSGVLLELLALAAREDPGIHSLLIVRRGHLVFDAAFYPYDGETPHDVASVTKSVTTTLLGAALHARALGRRDQPIVELLRRDPVPLDGAKRAITLEHLATMRSGLACGLAPGESELIAMTRSSDWVGFTLDLPMSDPPGQRFAYCSPGMHLLSAAITELTGESAADFAAHGLFAPMGIVPGDWPRDRAGLSHGWGDLRLHPRDMAKIGLLMLHDGEWNGRRLLPVGWVTTATRSRGAVGTGGDGYGLGWWISSGELAGAFEARGRGGQRVLVWPALDLVVVTTGAGFEPGVLVPFLSRAIRSETALPENQARSRQLADALAAARGGPPAVQTALPEFAGRISGQTYDLETNPLGFERIGFEFQSARGSLLLELSEAMGAGAGGRFRLDVGLDGRYRVSPAGPRGYAVALRAAWRAPSGLDLDYVEPSGSNAFVMRAEFDADRIHLWVRDRTGLYGEHVMVGRVHKE